jgi:ATP-dependent helicase/nuclease subunit A
MEDAAFLQRLNEEQRAAVLCESNAVVAAGAGSGKTAVLASRFAYLVVEKAYEVTEILTLTFTKKAATEMYQRIYATLSQLAQESPGRLKERARRGKEDFFKAPIYTLDAYSAQVVRQGAIRYGISPEFTVDPPRCRELVLEAALPFVITHREHPVLQGLYARKQPWAIAKELFAEPILSYSFIDEPLDCPSMTQKQIDLVCGEWDRRLTAITGTLRDLGTFMEEESSKDRFRLALEPLLAPWVQEALPFPSATELRAYFDYLLALPDRERIRGAKTHPLNEAFTASLAFLYAFHGLNLGLGKRGDPTKEVVKVLRKEAVKWSALGVFCLQGGLIISYMTLLQTFQDRVLAKKRAEGVLTFADVARLARRILLEHPDIRNGEKSAFKAIMIDEFQDNNALQKDVLFLLAEQPDRKDPSVPSGAELCSGKLFFVGDEKQSIYRFRGADVGVFRRLQQELPGVSLSLRKNYRSVPALIGGFNAFFGGSDFDPLGEQSPGKGAAVFIPPGPELPVYEAAYTPVCAGKGVGEREGLQPRIHIAILPKTKEETDEETEDGGGTQDAGELRAEDEFLDPHENEAFFVAEEIGRLLKEGYQPEDLALLFRAHTHQKWYEKQLRARGIPYISGGLGTLFTDGPAQDLMAVLRLVAYPKDTEAYGVLLRSPWVALSLGGLFLCLDSSEGPFADPLIPLLDEADQTRFRHGQALYRRTLKKAASLSCAELLSELWYAEGYRYETEWHPRTVVYRTVYDYLFNLAVQADAQGVGLAGFTDRIRALQDGDESLDEQDLDIPLERSGAVTLMTIHKSKGLEFPVVFVCGCGNPGRRIANTEAVYWSESAGLSFNPPLPEEWAALSGAGQKVKRSVFYEQAQGEERQKRTAELRRLLYVAMTRAERAVYLVGSLAVGGEGAEVPEEEPTASLVRKALEVKRAAQDKREDALLPGDAIVDDDTFFGLMLPAVAAHLPVEGEPGNPAFFTLTAIPRYRKGECLAAVGGVPQRAPAYTQDAPGLSRLLADLGPSYEAAKLMYTPRLSPRHERATTTRVAEALRRACALVPEYSGEGGADIFRLVDALLDRLAAEAGVPRFTPADFGALAHACVEALFQGREARFPVSGEEVLSSPEAKTLLDAGTALATRFIASPLGRIAGSAVFRKSEYRFRRFTETGIFIDGVMDLLFEAPERVYVVDFKTDREENPQEHLSQMFWYDQAARLLRKKPCETYLYYLRSGHALYYGGALGQRG